MKAKKKAAKRTIRRDARTGEFTKRKSKRETVTETIERTRWRGWAITGPRRTGGDNFSPYDFFTSRKLALAQAADDERVVRARIVVDG